MRYTTQPWILLPMLALVALALTAPALADEDPDQRIVRVHKCPQVIQAQGGGAYVLGMGNRGFLGVELTPLTPELRSHFGVSGDAGVMVGRVTEDSPAAAAGLAVGDIITRAGGEDVSSSRDLVRQVRDKEGGDELTLEYWRGGEPYTTAAILEERERCGIDIGNFAIDFGERLGDIGWDEIGEGIEDVDWEGIGEQIGREIEGVDWEGIGVESIAIGSEALESALEVLHQTFEGEEFQEHMKRLEDMDLERIEERMERVQERLHKLEEQMEEEQERLERDNVRLELHGEELRQRLADRAQEHAARQVELGERLAERTQERARVRASVQHDLARRMLERAERHRERAEERVRIRQVI